jgi:hypothetical protein
MVIRSLVRLTAATTALAAIGSLTTPVPARASTADIALNGRYLATSIGNYAKTNEVFRNELTVTSTWTITSTCTDPEDCNGTVSTDQGWTAPVSKTADTWVVDRNIPNWEPCADGSAAPGHQQYRFYRVDNDGQLDLTNLSTTYAGFDRTAGPSGGCGISRWLVIKMPFRLDKIS